MLTYVSFEIYIAFIITDQFGQQELVIHYPFLPEKIAASPIFEKLYLLNGFGDAHSLFHFSSTLALKINICAKLKKRFDKKLHDRIGLKF